MSIRIPRPSASLQSLYLKHSVRSPQSPPDKDKARRNLRPLQRTKTNAELKEHRFKQLYDRIKANYAYSADEIPAQADRMALDVITITGAKAIGEEEEFGITISQMMTLHHTPYEAPKRPSPHLSPTAAHAHSRHTSPSLRLRCMCADAHLCL